MKTLDQFETFLRDNIQATINEANNNSDCPGYGILMPNYSINTMDIRNESIEDSYELCFIMDEIEQEFNVSISVSDYDDLVIMTEKYESD